ncbi:hypothetical protein [Spongiactinospora sp. TRM90649]|uniref:sensor histidine kinase n=1 Tax=Spongiactinospora sp. TRM90649 TaxID=3031114 RepID=UPI0023F895E0|nr:hypothetical protein [Spongiactinospora sp. TRM90649]MDF5755999.1 hypothetical protein [Spongiactinospora sp. TRM90649]
MTAHTQLPDAESREPARAALDRVVAMCAAAMRGAEAVLALVAGLLGALPPVSMAWLGPMMALNLLWSGFFVRAVLRHGLRSWLVAGELAVTGLFCLTQGGLLVAGVAQAGASWVAVLVTMSIIITALAWPPRYAVAGGLVVALAHLAGALLAGFGGGFITLGINCVQIFATVALMTLLRRSAVLADIVLTRSREAEKAAAVLRARRADERGQYSRVHDTVLNTLTMVGAGGVERNSATLRKQAAADLEELERIARDAVTPAGPVDLDVRLAAVAARDDLRVGSELSGGTVPARVAEAFAGACAEALTNVARHSGVGAARLRSTRDGTRTLVEVADEGRGFDLAALPADRYGVRRSIIERMEAAGGAARVESGAHGTRVLLWWSP